MPVASNGPVDLYYESFGQPGNDTLLLINGLGSQCIAYDVALCEKFVKNGFFVIRFDNRDVGLSSKLDDVTPRIADVVGAVRTGSVPDVPYRLSDMDRKSVVEGKRVD